MAHGCPWPRGRSAGQDTPPLISDDVLRHRGHLHGLMLRKTRGLTAATCQTARGTLG